MRILKNCKRKSFRKVIEGVAQASIIGRSSEYRFYSLNVLILVAKLQLSRAFSVDIDPAVTVNNISQGFFHSSTLPQHRSTDDTPH